MSARTIIKAALEAKTLEQAENVNRLIEAEIGAAHRRPLGDRANNFALVTQGGSFDTKIIENVTNMQDAVIERAALARYGDRSAVPYRTPREAADDLFVGRDYQSLAEDVVVEFHEQVRRLGGTPPRRASSRPRFLRIGARFARPRGRITEVSEERRARARSSGLGQRRMNSSNTGSTRSPRVLCRRISPTSTG